MIAVLFFGLAFLGFLLIRRTGTSRAFRPGVALILLYFLLELAVYGVGLTHLDTAAIEANKTRAIIVVFAYTGVALYVLTRVQTIRQRTIVLGCLAVGLTFACVIGLLQTTGVDLRYLFKPPGFVVNLDYDIQERQGIRRSMGTSAHAIEFSVLAAVTVPVTLHFARYAANRQVRWLAALACGLALLAVPAAVSRSGVIALTTALLVYMWAFKVRYLAPAFVVAAAAVVGYIIAFPRTANALWQTILHSEEDHSVLTRIADYATVSETFRAYPIFGRGLGSALPTEYVYLDNEWLQAIVQGGIVGVTAMIVVVAGGIFGISAALRTASTPRERDQAYMIGSMFVGVLSSSFTFDLFSGQQASLIFFISFGLLWSTFTISFAGSVNNEPKATKSPVPG